MCVNPERSAVSRSSFCVKLKILLFFSTCALAPCLCRYIVRFTCRDCALAVLQDWFNNPGQQDSLLQRVELLVLDAQLLPAAAQGTAAAAAEVQSCIANESTGLGAGSADESRSDAGGSHQKPSSSSRCEMLSALGAVYNLLYQQHGFVGFMRKQLPGGVLRLGFIRQPGRMKSST